MPSAIAHLLHALPYPRPRPHCQRGAGIIEFIVLAVPLVLLGLGSIELTHWFHTRHTLGIALLDAGRVAITHHNRPQDIVDSFEQAVLPMYAADTVQHSRQRLQQALVQRRHQTGQAPWRIELLSPVPEAWADFADPALHVAGAGPHAIMNNHYLAEQDERYRQRGWPDGRGPRSGMNIYQANTLIMRLTWQHRPLLPWTGPLLRTLGKPGGSYAQHSLAHGYLPITRQIALLMQSHPVLWPDDPDGKVIMAKATGGSSRQPGPEKPAAGRPDSPTGPNGNQGPATEPAPHSQDAGAPPPDHTARDPHAGPDDITTGNDQGSAPPPATDYLEAEPAVDDPACGVLLCCV